MDVPNRGNRLLIFVIAYYAESTLRSVLERIPRSIFDEYDCQILVVDDASEDRTFAIGREYRQAHPDIPINVLRNELNQGYGGNQKVGYTFALEEGFDYVAMVHGDGQYAPEELPRLVAPLRRGEADAVFGSRMMTPLGALKGGMPLYKFVGNRILTTAQNALLGTHLSEFHSGYRVYSTASLRRIAFMLNSNDFHFDTEIILQLFNAKQRVVELAIPTFYGDEISRVNGMKYAKDVLLATLRNAAHRVGLLHRRRYEPVEGEPTVRKDSKLDYPSSHSYAVAAVRPGAAVLDIGDEVGAVAADLREKGCVVTVVDPHTGPPDGAPPFEPNSNAMELPFAVKGNDYLLMLDVIEHLKDPEQFLDRIRTQFDWSPKTLVLTTPNVAFIVPRLMLLFGQFNYGRAGILDRSHTRLFTFRSLRHLLLDAGFRIREVRGVPAPFPKVLGNGLLGQAAVRANVALIAMSRALFSYQIFIVAEATPDVAFVLRDAKSKGAVGPRNGAGVSTSAVAEGF